MPDTTIALLFGLLGFIAATVAYLGWLVRHEFLVLQRDLQEVRMQVLHVHRLLGGPATTISRYPRRAEP